MKDLFLLDMDDTLLDFPRAEEVNFFATLNGFGIPADSKTYARFHAINEGLWRALERGELDRKRLMTLRFERLCAECGFRADADALSRAYTDRFPEICFPFDGAADFLRELAARGSVYLVTNGGAKIQRRHMRDAGFMPYLSGAFISEEIGAEKPSEPFVAYVRAHIPDFEAQRAVWIGDSMTSDMVCAEKMGVDFILFIPARPAREQYREILARLQ